MLTIKIEVDTRKLIEASKRFPKETAKTIRQEMKMVGRDIQVLASSTAPAGKPGKPRMLARSVQFLVSESGMTLEERLDNNVAPYAPYVHRGTGIYGPYKKPFKVAPVTRKALHWVQGGQKFFSKGHEVKGQRPQPFLYNAFKTLRTHIVKRLQMAIHKAITDAGLR